MVVLGTQVVIFTGISYRSVWEADKYLRYGDAPIPQTDHPYIQFDKSEFVNIILHFYMKLQYDLVQIILMQ